MYALVEIIKRKYRDTTPDDWPMVGDTVHFKDKLNGRLYCGEAIEWVRIGNYWPLERGADIFWRVKLADGAIINCEYCEVLQVDRTEANRLKLLREEG
ncbi:hypothetical protein [Providencia phage vB_PreS-PatoteraRojo]|nr:hypothetical protein [Providencia phage vB_PreS-PatoteraRojo]